MILGWHQNLQKHEVPPEHLWEDSKGLELWWGTVEERRRTDPFGRNSRDSEDDDSESGTRTHENDYARALRAGNQ